MKFINISNLIFISLFITKISAQDWSSQGANIDNSRYISLNQTKIRGVNLNLLNGPKFNFNAPGGVNTVPVRYNYWCLYDHKL